MDFDKFAKSFRAKMKANPLSSGNVDLIEFLDAPLVQPAMTARDCTPAADDTSEGKICSLCRRRLPLSAFGGNKRSADGLEYRCRRCQVGRKAKLLAQRKDYWTAHDPYVEHPTGKKTCHRCGAAKTIQDFHIDRSAPDGTQYQCKTCTSSYIRVWKYGVPLPLGARCAICGSERRAKLAIDHCHRTAKVRGVLCMACNHGLGFFKDSPERLEAAIAYVLRPPGIREV